MLTYIKSLFKGCFSDSMEVIPTVLKKTMEIGSVGMCQELCRHENYNKFAVKVGIANIYLFYLFKSVFLFILFQLLY